MSSIFGCHRLNSSLFRAMSAGTPRGLLRPLLSSQNRSFSDVTTPSQCSFPAIFARGGTSNGLIIHARHLPPRDDWPSILPAAMGSPDPYGRQLDGMGSGVSSTSKICVVAPSAREDADVDFTFVQVGVRDGALDLASNCGNMSSAIGPVCLNEGWLARHPVVETVEVEEGGGRGRVAVATVRVFNTNTAKIIHSRFQVAVVSDGESPRYRYFPDGDYAVDGVPGTGSRVTLSFLRPAGAKTGRALPTGNVVDTLVLPDGGTVQASLIDVSNPGVFVRAADLVSEKDIPSLTPAAVEADAELKARLECVRMAGAAAMGMDPRTESVPKIVMVLPPEAATDVDVRCLAMSMGQAHRAVPLTLALCLGAAVGIPGTIPRELARPLQEEGIVTIGHPSGRLDVGTRRHGDEILSAELHRTTRVLMKGEVFY